MTEKKLAEALGISPRTLLNSKKRGFEVEKTEDGKVDIAKSIHRYVSFQSEQIRNLSVHSSKKKERKSEEEEFEGAETDDSGRVDWKREKEKQAAIKAKRENDLAFGKLVPSVAMVELYNAPLSLIKTKLLGLTNEIQKRVELDPALAKLIDDIVVDTLQRLDEKGADELREVIQRVIERYSEYYSAAEEDADSSVGDGE
ncbi:hypothetical protein J7H88_003574 [Vibrio parahaemolyticus]|nr:hypothetical protein [Vibrio parahaemolyticus]EJC6874026.1 hypothetical protein [Vibrio parahaemolyticus]EKL9826510.1 hypothetical protein [Vibrio parahaemolyticus]